MTVQVDEGSVVAWSVVAAEAGRPVVDGAVSNGSGMKPLNRLLAGRTECEVKPGSGACCGVDLLDCQLVLAVFQAVSGEVFAAAHAPVAKL